MVALIKTSEVTSSNLASFDPRYYSSGEAVIKTSEVLRSNFAIFDAT